MKKKCYLLPLLTAFRIFFIFTPRFSHRLSKGSCKCKALRNIEEIFEYKISCLAYNTERNYKMS